MNHFIPDLEFRCPQNLVVTPTRLRRVIVVGQCLMAGWPGVLKSVAPDCECDFFLFNNSQLLPEAPPHPAADYDFQVVQIPLRSILPEAAYFRLSYADASAYEELFRDCCDRLSQFLATAMRWNVACGLLTFVANFAVPQQNPMGRLLPRYDLRNFVYFTERLNQHLAEEIQTFKNAYLFDLDQIIANFGRKYVQDDVLLHFNHGAALAQHAADRELVRLEPMPAVRDVFEEKVFLLLQLGWIELLAMYRTIRQLDMVKLVVFDIDDTLWRGVAAEGGVGAADRLEGWPLGITETIGHLKRRGVLLALVSKNEATILDPIFSNLFGGRLSLDDFAIRKVNWKPKTENLDEIMRTLNLLPRNVVFVDDNPVERAAIETAFPEVRTLGPNPLLWRRILLWSAETQVAAITSESAARTDMMQAQVERESQREKMSREEFLASLHVEVGMREVNSVEHPDFARVLELINKSNQFNTTGRRWTNQEFQAAFDSGTRVVVFDVRDRFTQYGLVGVAVVRDVEILQFVMSCRVLGMEVEIGVVAELLRNHVEQEMGEMAHADFIDTELNLAARDLWARCGFEQTDHGWTRAIDTPLKGPAHVRFVGA